MVRAIKAESTAMVERARSQTQVGDLMLRAVLEASLDAVIVIQGAGTVIGWSKAATETFGWTTEEALNRPLRELIIPEHYRKAHEDGLRKFLETGKARVLGKRIQITALDKSGCEFPVELSILQSRQLGSDIFVGFLRDLREKEAAEAKISALQAELIHVSRHAAMGAMASMLAHELNQPLAAASNYLSGGQRILATLLDPMATEVSFAINRSQEALERASATISGVREMIARRPLKQEKCDLHLLVREVLRLFGASLPLVPEVNIERDARWINVNKIQIEQVLVSLVRNSFEAMEDQAQRSLTIHARPIECNMIEVRVRDSGRGIGEAMRDKLFSPFTSIKDDGLGLGLSICRTIVEQHQGKIWAEAHSKGTSLCFTIPAAETDDDG
ncbi:MAG: PAS domain S-box protein [Actinobacteria bacterium]|nr:PAS domain S-box protein [Actinomycetota bacterium]